MVEFGNTWKKYGLVANPFFQEALESGKGLTSFESFVGRETEVNNMISAINTDIRRLLVVGEPGVGKTSLVNYVRDKASKANYFTPVKPIELYDLESESKVVLLTLSALYEQIKKEIEKNEYLKFSETIYDKLESLFDFVKLNESNKKKVNSLNFHSLKLFFDEVVEEIIKKTKSEKIIIHYDNLERIELTDSISQTMLKLRDFLQNQHTIFIFVGDTRLIEAVESKTQLSSNFHKPVIVTDFSYEETKEILYKRFNHFKDEELNAVFPFEENAIKELYNLHKKNLRQILNSLTSCVSEIKNRHTPFVFDKNKVKEILYEKVLKENLDKLGEPEMKIFSKLFESNKDEFDSVKEVSDISGVAYQNVSQTYLPNLIRSGVCRIKEKEKRKKVITLTEHMVWYKLKPTSMDKKEIEKKMIDKKIQDFL